MCIRDSASAVVLYHDGIVLLYRNIYLLTIACQRFVHAIVNYFINQMMQLSLIHISSEDEEVPLS